MAEFVLKENTGTAFTNKKRSEDKHPSHTGEINVAGKLHFLDLWVNQDKNGNNYFKVKIGSEKKPRQNDDYQRPVMDSTKAGGFVDDLDAPF